MGPQTLPSPAPGVHASTVAGVPTLHFGSPPPMTWREAQPEASSPNPMSLQGCASGLPGPCTQRPSQPTSRLTPGKMLFPCRRRNCLSHHHCGKPLLSLAFRPGFPTLVTSSSRLRPRLSAPASPQPLL